MAQWNDVLFEHVFVRGGAADARPVTRIPATTAFFGQVAGDPANGDAARNAFERRQAERGALTLQHAFGDDGRWRAREWARRQRAGYPPWFADLAFSVHIATATEETADEGDFRQRLCLVVGADGFVFALRALPDLWIALAQWINAQRRRGVPLRPLRLPDPQHETLIGHSKRLAFPTFRDANKLAGLLTRRLVDAESPFPAIIAAIGAEAERFSPAFQREFSDFRRCAADLQRAPERLALHPFWGAVTDATWAPHQPGASSRAEMALELDSSDLAHVGLRLLADRACEVPGLLLEPLPAYRVVDDMTHVARGVEEDLDAAAWGFMARTRSSPARPGEGGLQRCIRQGVVVFDASASPSRTTLAARRLERVHLLMHDSLQASWACVPRREAGTLGRWRRLATGWSLLASVGVGDILQVARWFAPFAQTTAFRDRVVQARISVIGPPRVGSAILVRPGVACDLRCPAATELRAEWVRGGDDHDDAAIPVSLQRARGGAWSIEEPHGLGAGSGEEDGVLHVVATANEDWLAELQQRTTRTVSAWDYKQLAARDGWLREAASSDLVAAADLREPASSLLCDVADDGAARPDAAPSALPLIQRSDAGLPQAASSDPFDWEESWQDAIECLAGYALARQCLAWEDIAGVLERAGVQAAADGGDRWVPRDAAVRALEDNAILDPLISGRWNARAWVAIRPTLAFVGPQRKEAVLVGLVPALLRAALVAEQRGGAVALRRWVAVGCRDPGPVSVEFLGQSDAAERLARHLSIRIVELADAGPPAIPHPMATLAGLQVTRVNPSSDREVRVRFIETAEGRAPRLFERVHDNAPTEYAIDDGTMVRMTRLRSQALRILAALQGGRHWTMSEGSVVSCDARSGLDLPLRATRYLACVHGITTGVVRITEGAILQAWAFPDETHVRSMLGAWMGSPPVVTPPPRPTLRGRPWFEALARARGGGPTRTDKQG